MFVRTPVDTTAPFGGIHRSEAFIVMSRVGVPVDVNIFGGYWIVQNFHPVSPTLSLLVPTGVHGVSASRRRLFSRCSMLHRPFSPTNFARFGISPMSSPLDDRSDVGRATDLSFTDDFAPVSTEKWTETIESDLRGKSIERLDWHSVEGITLHPFYRAEDLSRFVHLSGDPLPLVSTGSAEAHAPGPDGYTAPAGHASAGNPWQIRQDIAAPDPKQAAAQAEAALAGGADAVGLLIASDDRHTPAPQGIRVDTPRDLRATLRDVYLNAAPVHLDARPGHLSPALLLPEFADLLRETRDKNGAVHGGTVTYDPVAALATGALRHAETAFDLAAEVVENAADVPLRTLAVDTRAYHESGASAVQELAFMIAALTETFDQCTERGYSVNSLCTSLHIVTAVDTSYFVEIGKLRALRLLAARVLNGFADASRRTGGEPGDDSPDPIHPSGVFVQVQTAGRTQTIYGSYVNMLRGSTEAASAVIGGCDVLTVAPFDGAFRDPSEFSNRIARNTQLILRHESHLDQVADPSAGSYYIEAVTDELVTEAWALFQEIEAGGGMLAALQRGDIAEQIGEVRSKRIQRVDRRKHALVGTSHYPDVDETRLDDLADRFFDTEDANPSDANPADVDAETAELADRLHSGSSVLGAVTEALDDGASLSAVSAALASIIDAQDSDTIPPLSPLRLGAPYEAIRLRTERYTKRTGRRPTVLLAPHGPAGPRSARANFARNVLGLAGFRIVEPISFDSAEAAVDTAVDEGADIVVACSSDDTYTESVPALCAALTDAESRAVLVVAGSPDAIGAPVTDIADRFVHRKAPLIDTLEQIQRDIGLVDL